MIVSWYSSETASRTNSAMSGWLDRSIDMVLPVQSWNSRQTTTGFGFVSRARAIRGA